MNNDEICEEIKKNLFVLGINKNKSLSDVSYFTLEDIYGLYKNVIKKGHVFYFQNADEHRDAKTSYKFFLNLFREHGITDLGEVIPREYQTDLIGNFDRVLEESHSKEHQMIDKYFNEMKSNHLKSVKRANENKIKNYNEYYAKSKEINKKIKKSKKIKRK